MDLDYPVDMSERAKQPQCSECNHSASFHGGGKTRCRALGCGCTRWHKPKDVAIKKIAAAH